MTRHTFRLLSFISCFAFVIAAASPLRAQSASPASAAQAPAGDDDDAVLRPAEPDFSVVNMPTTLPLPVHGSDFHLTHRFGGNLEEGTFSDQASNLFGFDQGATVGFEYRYGVIKHLEAMASRTSFDKDIQFAAKYDGFHQSASHPFGVSALLSVEGTNNFQDAHAPALGVVVSRTVATRAGLYASPMWVHNSGEPVGVLDRDTFFVGLGARVRVLETVYLVGEVSPRVAGYAPDDPEFGFGVEKRVGGHVFQLTFTNSAGTTFGQLARGAQPSTLHLGFNLTRKFF